MKKRSFSILFALVLVISLSMVTAVPVAGATTWTVDDDGVECPTADYTTIQAAINAANDNDTILVYPGTYDPQIEVTPPCWGGHYYAQGIVVWKTGLTIQAFDPDPANTIIESTFPGWMDWWRIQILTGGSYGTPPNCFPITGGYSPGTSAAPSAIMVVKDDVTIEGFTIRSTYIGDPGQTGHPNSAKLRRLRKAILLFVTRTRPSPRASTSRSTRADRSFDSVLSEKNSSGVTKYPSPASLPTECS